MVGAAAGVWLLDNSAWQRGLTESTPGEFRSGLAQLLSEGRLAVCPPFLLEAGYSARSGQDHAAMSALFENLKRFELTAAAADRAVECQARLAAAGHHRMPPADIMIAVIADVEGLGILHYDAAYEVILEHTDLRYESRWLAPRGSL